MKVTEGTEPHTNPTSRIEITETISCGAERGAECIVQTLLMSQLTELRAILAPLLDDPYDDYDGMEQWCRFCEVQCDPFVRETKCDHAPGCPVLDRDRLLGRQP